MVVDVGNQRIEAGAFGGLAFGEGDRSEAVFNVVNTSNG
jgi:hypothetical protein